MTGEVRATTGRGEPFEQIPRATLVRWAEALVRGAEAESGGPAALAAVEVAEQLQIAAEGGPVMVSVEGVDNPVASVTLHGVGEPAAWAPGDRYVWTSTPVDPQVHARVFPGSAGPGPRLKLRGVVVADPGAGQMLTVQHDGETDTALVYRDQLTPERDRG